MRLFLLAAAVLAAGLLFLPQGPRADVSGFQQLAELLDRRLTLSEEVAKAKWNSGQPIRDPAREQAVTDAMVAEAVALGVDPAFAQAVIEAQIAASRLVQEELHAAWQQQGQGKFADALDLKTGLRPQFDALNHELLAALLAVAAPLETAAGRAAFDQVAGQVMAARSPAVRDTALAPFAVK